MSDLIDRQAAINYCYQLINVEHEQGSDEMNYDQERVNQTETILHHLEFMPSAQPDSNELSKTQKKLDTISRQAAIEVVEESRRLNHHQDGKEACAHEYEHRHFLKLLIELPPAQPEIVRCCKCSYWDRDSLRHQYNDFRDWNEAECKMLAERDPYDEINRYTEADDYCSRAERKHDE